MSDIIQDHKIDFNKIIEFLKTEMAGLRTNRVSPSLIENVMVEAYDSALPLIQLASVSNPEPRTLFIQPWDKALAKNIEKALLAANVGAQPTLDSASIRLSFPALTEERRKEIVKQLNQKLEEARIGLRQVREKIRETIIQQEKNKEFSEDSKFKYLEELEEVVKKYNETVRELGSDKEEEIMKI